MKAKASSKTSSYNSVKLAFLLIGGGLATQAVSTTVAHADTVTTVKTGDSLKSLAKDNYITVKALADANNLDTKDDLKINQKITIPDAPKKHTVVKGESVSKIAHKYGLKTEDVLKWNDLSWDNSTIYIGDKLNLQDPAKAHDNTDSTNTTTNTATSATNTTVKNAKVIGNTKAEQIVNLAIQYANMNIPYVWGGSTPAGFDCSGLTQYVFGQAGISIGRNTIAQEANVTTVADISDASQVAQVAQPGDLLFWGNHGSSYHVGIYIGNGQFVAAPQPGQNVSVQTVSNYFMPSFVGRV